MKKSSKVLAAEKKALERFDYIIETYEAPDFVQIVGSQGGDVKTFRFYDNGSVCQK